MVVSFTHKGDFKKTTKFLAFVSRGNWLKQCLMKYGQKGVDVLSEATPVDTGITANSWSYSIEVDGGSLGISWNNTSNNKSISIVYLLVNGHGTGTGGWVEGRDFVTPSIQPVMDQIVNDLWEEVKSA